jgi:6-phosphogluconolactonase
MDYLVERIEPRIFAGTVADEIIASLNDAISDRGRATLVLAGGKTPSSIYRLLAIPPRVEDLDWSKVWIYLGDERFVPKTDGRSNYKMVHDTFLMQLGSTGPKVFAVDTALESADAAAKAYAKTISEQENLKTGESPVFDLVLLGIGEDGHTASLFPGSALLDKSSQICAACSHPEDQTERITLTPNSIKSARRIAFIVKGEAKAAVVQRVLEGNEDQKALPAMIYREAKGHVTWFLDSEAAMRLTPEKTS